VLPTLLLALTATGAPFASGGASAEAPVEPVRVLLLGDSLTHGSAGDWTWRYRFWRHLAETEAAPVDLVGPASDLRAGSQDYVDPAFDTDHASLWGAQLTEQVAGAFDLAATYRPDVVVTLIGLNDVAWKGRSPAQVEEDMRRTIAELRRGAPGVDVVVGLIPLTEVPLVPETNARYSSLAAELDSAGERVVTAATDVGYRRSTPERQRQTYDPVHPNSRGEVRIAAAVADAVASLGIGEAYPRPLPALPVGPRWGAELSGKAKDRAVRLTWVSAPGTTGEVVHLKDVTAGGRWVRVSGVVTEGAVTVRGLRNGHRYHAKVKPVKDWAQATDVRSNVLSLRPRPRG